MGHLTDRQLHILLGALCALAGAALIFFLIVHGPHDRQGRALQGPEQFSEGWIAVYQTTDEEQLAAFQDSEDAVNVAEGFVREIVNLPASFSVRSGDTIELTHKVPEMSTDTLYLEIATKQEKIVVDADGEVIYESTDRDGYLPDTHVIALSPRFRDATLHIYLTGIQEDQITLDGIYVGEYSEILAGAWIDNGIYLVIGGMLSVCSLAFFAVWLLADNRIRKKRPLLVHAGEMLVFGLLFMTDSQPARIWMQWGFGYYFLESMLLILLCMLHILQMRSAAYKKRLLSLSDGMIFVCGVYEISVLVLHGFKLLQFDTIRVTTAALFLLVVVLCALTSTIAVYVYRRREEAVVCYANAALTLGFVIQGLRVVIGGDYARWYPYAVAGIAAYLCMLGVSACRQACSAVISTEPLQTEQQLMRERILEEMNPDLIFASFRTMQNLIKRDSANSVKMIYYISVYFRSNLKAIRQPYARVSFEEELAHILAYLTLQRTRYAGLSFTVECKVKAFDVPRGCIEALVENAVEHGLAVRDGNGNVALRTYEREEGYAIQVIDNGVGFDASNLKKVSRTSLKCIIGELEHTWNAHTEVVSKEGKGTVITLILPVEHTEDTDGG